MKCCSKCGQEKHENDFYVRSNGKLRSDCKACFVAAVAERRDRDREKFKEYRRGWSEKNRDAERSRLRLIKSRDPDKERERLKKYSTPERYKRRLTERRSYYESNRDKFRHYVMLRNARRIQASPAWANLSKVREIYSLAMEFREAGFDVHVDHIVPLRGKLVCGLHNEFNLRVCLAQENMSKGNRFDQEFLFSLTARPGHCN